MQAWRTNANRTQGGHAPRGSNNSFQHFLPPNFLEQVSRLRPRLPIARFRRPPKKPSTRKPWIEWARNAPVAPMLPSGWTRINSLFQRMMWIQTTVPPGPWHGHGHLDRAPAVYVGMPRLPKVEGKQEYRLYYGCCTVLHYSVPVYTGTSIK